MSNLTEKIHKGIVMFWNYNFGYGFIEYVENGEIKKIYVHYSKLIGCKRLKKYQYVRFMIGSNEQGPIAEDVEVIHFAKTKTNTRAVSHKKV